MNRPTSSKTGPPRLRLFDSRSAATEYANRPRKDPNARYRVLLNNESGKFYVFKSVYKPMGAGSHTYYEQVLCADGRWRSEWKVRFPASANP